MYGCQMFASRLLLDKLSVKFRCDVTITRKFSQNRNDLVADRLPPSQGREVHTKSHNPHLPVFPFAASAVEISHDLFFKTQFLVMSTVPSYDSGNIAALYTCLFRLAIF